MTKTPPHTRVSPTVAIVAAGLLQLLRARPRTTYELAAALEVSLPTTRRAIEWLEVDLEAPVEYERKGRLNSWVLKDHAWQLPSFQLTDHGFEPTSKLGGRPVA